MGHGHAKRKKQMKLMFLSQAQREIDRLNAENKALKEDPNSVIGQFIERFNGVIQQNNRLSALTASLIKMNGDRVIVPKTTIEEWKNCRLQIKVETADGVESFEEAKELIFTYETHPIEEKGQMPIEQPDGDKTPCADPECQLNKDGIKHIHAHKKLAPATEAPLTPEQLAAAAQVQPGPITDVTPPEGEEPTLATPETAAAS